MYVAANTRTQRQSTLYASKLFLSETDTQAQVRCVYNSTTDFNYLTWSVCLFSLIFFPSKVACPYFMENKKKVVGKYEEVNQKKNRGVHKRV